MTFAMYNADGTPYLTVNTVVVYTFVSNFWNISQFLEFSFSGQCSEKFCWNCSPKFTSTIFPEISGKLWTEISGNFPTRPNPTHTSTLAQHLDKQWQECMYKVAHIKMNVSFSLFTPYITHAETSARLMQLVNST